MYLGIGNIPKDIRRKPSRTAQMLIGYIPVTKLECISNKTARRRTLANLYHSCMAKLLDPTALAAADTKTGTAAKINIPVKKLDTKKMTAAITAAQAPQVKQNVLVMGEKIRTENGLKNAINEIEKYFMSDR